MKNEIRELYPTWIDEIDGTKQVAGFTADMDGLLCSSFAKHHLGLEINVFYDFRNQFKADVADDREVIYFDCAITDNQKTFDNHLTMFGDTYNRQSANINNVMGVHTGRYTDKFAMSTLIQLYALYQVPLPETLQGKLILLCCDVGFKGYYDGNYQEAFLSYLDIFNMMELVPILEMFTIKQMYEFMLRAQMNMKIEVQRNGRLYINMDDKNYYGSKWLNFETGMDLDWFSKHLEYPVTLPDASFTLTDTFINKKMEAHLFTHSDATEAFSYAFINSRTVLYSMRKDE